MKTRISKTFVEKSFIKQEGENSQSSMKYNNKKKIDINKDESGDLFDMFNIND